MADLAPATTDTGAPSPLAPGWGDVRRAVITAADGCADAMQRLAADPGDGSALAMAQMAVAILTDLGTLTRRVAFDEAVIEAERLRAADEAMRRRTVRRRLSAVLGVF